MPENVEKGVPAPAVAAQQNTMLSSATSSDFIHSAMEIGSSQFIKGFFAGQLVLIIFVIALIKLLFLRGPFDLHRSRDTRKSKANLAQKAATIPASKSISESELLKLCGYDMNGRPESCLWLNVLMAQIITSYRSNAAFRSFIVSRVDKLLNEKIRKEDQLNQESPLDNVKIMSINLGSGFPCIKSSRFSYSESGRIRLDLDLEWSDTDLSIDVESQLLLHWPVPLFVGLPFQLGLSLVKLKGTLSLEVCGPNNNNHSNNSNDNNGQHTRNASMDVIATFLNDFELDIAVKSLIGHKTKVKDLPKVGEILLAALRGLIEDEMVWPNYQVVSLPSFNIEKNDDLNDN
jgi:maintenance of morphology protein 1